MTADDDASRNSGPASNEKCILVLVACILSTMLELRSARDYHGNEENIAALVLVYETKAAE